MPDDTDYEELAGRTIDEIKEHVEQHDVDLERLLDHEREGKDRKTLKQWLDRRIDEQEPETQDVAEEQDTEAPISRDEDGVTFQLSTKQAFIGTFLIGLIAGGFLMAGAFSAAGATGALAGLNPDQAGESPSDAAANDDTTDSGSEDNSNRVMLSEDMLQDEPTLGSSDAPVTIVEYSDYGCPWCAEWAGFDAIPQRPIDQEQTLDKIESNFVNDGQVRFIYKDYPVPQLHPNAPQAHMAANCILEQGQEMYWGYHDLLFDERDRWTRAGGNNPGDTFPDLAEQVGADTSAFNQCYENSDGSEVQADRDGIHQADGQLGTPTIFVGNTEDGFRKVEGAQPYSTLETLIQSEIDRATS